MCCCDEELDLLNYVGHTPVDSTKRSCGRKLHGKQTHNPYFKLNYQSSRLLHCITPGK